jgi:excinuclease ABC subunit C
MNSITKPFPAKPGVYYFKDKTGKIIYIGKAISLKHRVASYFNKNDHSPKTRQMVSEIKSAKYIVANSEFEALLLEAKLVKEHRPKYNVMLKDDKRYLYIALSKETAPRIFLIRKPETESGLLDWYGPFPSAGNARQVLRTIRPIFPYRTRCKIMEGKPCIDFQIGLCPGTCFKNVPEYHNTIHNIRQILSGKTKILIRNLEKKMQHASDELNFEEAQKMKKQLISLVNVTQGWRTIPEDKIEGMQALEKIRKILVKFQGLDPIMIKRIEGYDVSNLGRDIIVSSMVVFIDGQADKAEYRKFKITFKSKGVAGRKNLEEQNDPEGIKQTIIRRLSHPDWLYPQLILVDGGKPQVSAAFQALKTKRLAGQTALLGLAKKEDTIVLPVFNGDIIKSWKMIKMPRNSDELKLLQQIRDEAHRFAQNYYKLLHQKKLNI